MVNGFRSFGEGLQSIEKFCMAVNMPPPMTPKNFTNLVDIMADKYNIEARISLSKAAAEVRKKVTGLADPGDVTVQSGVSVDGAWQRRGHASHNGFVSAISTVNSKVLDVEVMSNFCASCNKMESKMESREYMRWKVKHAPQCNLNHSGSAGSMESSGAVRIFGRSENHHNIQYTEYLGDGDSSSFKSVSESKPYGPVEIVKKECIGHVQKRMGTRTRALVKKNAKVRLSDGKKISGRGRLTQKIQDKCQNYYGIAIRENLNDLPAMQNAIKAGLYHIASTDMKPQHHLCPKGPESWCGYNTKDPKFKHRCGLPDSIVDLLLPIYDDLSSDELLQKCTHGRTQNSNESFNKMVWDYYPKTVYTNRTSFSLAVDMAICQFNDGNSSVLSFYESLGIEPGLFTRQLCAKIDNRRITKSVFRCSEKAKHQRKRLRAKRKGLIDTYEENEGTVYESGGF
ncbi:uncharacterized protein LOC141902155 [Tubulanus polymorphus]|uniref:uncharacterized protein LOC141902155 n=1 Tax=Tubulanus polymorphus TaxID=672921 RepID=UPI003DA3F13D